MNYKSPDAKTVQENKDGRYIIIPIYSEETGEQIGQKKEYVD